MIDPAVTSVVILAGGRGARFGYESQVMPKPLIEVAGRPMLRHIIDLFYAQGFRHFEVAAGYLGGSIVRYFDQTLEPTYDRTGVVSLHAGRTPSKYEAADLPGDLTVFVMDTGQATHTGGRLARVAERLPKRPFILTYGDGLADVDMRALLAQHEQTGATVTMTAVRPPGRFGVIDFQFLDRPEVLAFDEKPSEGWINGGFMVMEHQFVGKYLADGREHELESDALSRLAQDGGLCAYRHSGFWHCMDTRRDLEQIEAAVEANGGKLPWRREV